jgi:predicted lipoprotein with Yx(FWY)xxD motif
MTLSRSRHLTYGAALAAVATLAVGCGSSSSGGSGGQALQPAGGSSSTSAAHGSGLTTRSTSLGKVVTDPSGKTVYELVGNPPSNSKCTGSCTSIWPPVMSGGKIAVFHGHPVFTFTGDSSPGQTNGQGVRDSWGQWLALGANGRPVSAASGSSPASSPTSVPSSSGGYGY